MNGSFVVFTVRKIEPIPYSPPPKPPTPVVTNVKDKSGEGKGGKKGGKDKEKEAEKATTPISEPVILVCNQCCLLNVFVFAGICLLMNRKAKKFWMSFSNILGLHRLWATKELMEFWTVRVRVRVTA